VRNNYQRKERKSNHKFEVVRGQELMVRVPLPMAEVWAEPSRELVESFISHLAMCANGL
jgi:hypothetical protein